MNAAILGRMCQFYKAHTIDVPEYTRPEFRTTFWITSSSDLYADKSYYGTDNYLLSYHTRELGNLAAVTLLPCEYGLS